MKTLFNIITWPYRWYKERQAFKKRMKKLRGNDEPFIYW
jgi:hypothetical protein